MINSYPKIYALGHRELGPLFFDPVIVEEKVDGSQFSFGVLGHELHCRSKGQALVVDAPDKMFAQAVATAQELAPLLRPDWVYRGEYLQKPKHNTLAYDRIPKRHIALFDVCPGLETYLSVDEKAAEAERLGLETVPALHVGPVASADELLAFLERVSFLGGQKIEGVVVKNYARFGADKKALMGKHVSEAFKEVHRHEWKKENPGGKDMIASLCEQYRTEARWNKAIQHLRERGELTESPKDIGPLLREVQTDIEAECHAEIAEKLYAWARKDVLRAAGHGLPEWYKEQLTRSQTFASADATSGQEPTP